MLKALEDLGQDLRYSLRGLRRSPGFTTAALLILALTIGGVSTVLSLYYGIVARPVPIDHPEDVVVVAAVMPGNPSSQRVSYADYVQIRDRLTTVRDLAANGSGGLFFLRDHGETRKRSIAIVSANFFSLLGARPALGRFFDGSEDRVPGRDHVAVLSHRLWRERWGGTPAALGAVILIDGLPLTVIGVAPETFSGLDPRPSEVYVPTMVGLLRGVGCDAIADPECAPSFQMIGRLRSGVTIEKARAELSTVHLPHWTARVKDESGPMTLAVFRPRGAFGLYGEFGMAEAFPEGVPLFAVAGMCLVLGLANLGGLLLARGTSRARELAIRASLGPAPRRLLRQLLAESLLLAVCGGALGILLSLGLTRSLSALFYEIDASGQPNRFDLHPDPLVIVCITVLSLIAGFVFGLPPALKSIRLGSVLSLSRSASAVAPRPRSMRGLIAVQVSLALALVALAAIVSMSARQFVTAGHFDPGNVALLRVEGVAPERKREFQRAIIRRLEAVPGVLAVSVWNRGSVIGSPSVRVARTDGGADGGGAVSAGIKDVAPRFFEVLGTPLLRGRDFDERDSGPSPRVAIVDDGLARRLWPGGNAVGSTLVVAGGAPLQVVGLVADVSASLRGEAPRPEVYVPLWQNAADVNSHFCVRVQGDPSAALPALMRAIDEVQPGIAISETMPMTAHLAATDELRTVRTTAAVASYGALLALVLSAVGVYGALALSVTRRTREIGVRMAVGARPHDVITLMLRSEIVPLAAGVVAGLPLALAGSRVVRHLTYGPASNDPLAYGGAVLLVTATGLLACWIPTRRATRVDPVVALRAD